MIPVLIPAATAAVARLNALVAGAALIKAVAPVEAALVEAALVEAVVLVEAMALVEAVALIEAVALVDAARVGAALVAGSICHRPPRKVIRSIYKDSAPPSKTYHASPVRVVADPCGSRGCTRWSAG